MSKPIPGRTYTAQAGDTYESLAARAYGDSTRAALIQSANQSLNPGDPVIIPIIRQRAAIAPTGVQPDQLTIKVGNRELAVSTCEIARAIDAGAYGWTATFPWEIGEDRQIDALLRPFRYPACEIFIGTELILTGVLYGVSPELSAGGRTVRLTGTSFTADAIDSTVAPPYERNNITLEQRAAELVAANGVSVTVSPGVDTGGAFDRVTAEQSDTVFAHLSKLATQRGVLLTTNPASNLVITRAGSGGSVGTLREGGSVVTSWAGDFDGRTRFSAYRAIGQSPGANSKPSVAVDPAVPRTRFMTFRFDETTRGDIKGAAEWRRSKQLADALRISVPVNTWLSPAGEPWAENTLVTIISETLSLPDGFNFLIRSVRYTLDSGGRRALLTLVPPQVYTGEELIDPWGS